MTNYAQIIENDSSEEEKYITYVEICEENDNDINRLIKQINRSDPYGENFKAGYVENNLINKEIIDFLNSYEFSTYMKTFVIAEINPEVFDKLKVLEAIEDEYELYEEITNLLHKRNNFNIIYK